MDATTSSPAPKRAGFIALFIKLGGKLFSLLLKLVKGLKAGKIALAGGSFAAYAVLFSWQFALVLIASLLFHEMGHMWAMRRYGMKTKGIYLIPFLGAAAVAEDRFPSRKAELNIALMGPVWGAGMALAAYVTYLATGEALFAALAGWMAMLNLFNLLPINPLDGGRVMKSVAYSVSSRLGSAFLWSGIAAGFYAAWRFNLGLLWLLIIAGVVELLQEQKRVRRVQDRERILGALASALGVEAEPEAVIARITTVHGHLAQGVTGTFPPALLDENPYTGTFSAREWTSYFQARVEGCAHRARIPRRKLFDGSAYYATDPGSLTIGDGPSNDGPGGHSPLFAFLRDSSNAMPTMRPSETAFGFLAYAGLAIALVALMFAASHVPAADAALRVFMD